MGDDTMVGFGHKQAWLAVRHDEPTVVIAALGGRDLGPVPWRDGIDLAYLTDDRLVVTPALPGARHARWLLVAGRWLFGAVVDVAELSAVLGAEVQLFATHRVGELHRWWRAVDGRLVRAFAYAGGTGEVLDWRGDPDEAERAVGLPADQDADTDVLVSEGDVMRIARAWSIDPTALGGRPASGPLRAAAVPSPPPARAPAKDL